MPTSRFSKAENGVITDSKTGKKWLVVFSAPATWTAAETAILGLLEDGGGWRFPTLAELQQIFEKGKGTRNIDPLFAVTGTTFWADEIDATTAGVFICCARNKDWRYKIYDLNTNTLAVKE